MVPVAIYIFKLSSARLGAGFGSALADTFLTESVRILAERLSQWESSRLR